MIKAVIFDCFGVLVTGSLDKFIDEYVHDYGSLQEIHDLNDQANAGIISYKEMINQYAKIAGISAENAEAVLDRTPKNKKLLSYIRSKLADTYKIGFLSNAAGNWVEELLGPDDAALFDEVVLSYDVKLVKPNSRIYELIAQRLGVEPEECLFVDDIERYCIGAEDAGMKAVVYRAYPQAVKEIERVLEISNTDI